MNKRVEIIAQNFCSSVRDGTHDSPKQINKGGKPLITTRHLKDGNIDLKNAYNISEEDYFEINKRSKVDKWDVLLSMIGTVGEVSLIKNEPNFAIKNLGLFKIGDEINAKWLYFFLKSKIGQDQIRNLKQGSTQQYISLKSLRNLKILVPTNEEEKKNIVKILYSIDEKIELNQKKNQTLESIANLIFKSWFIDFDPVRKKNREYAELSKEISNLFPSSLEKYDLGEKPKNWVIENLDNLTSKITTGLNPRKNFILGEGKNYYVTIKNLGENNVVLDQKCDRVDELAILKINSRSDLKKDDILFSGIGTIGKVVYIFDEPKNWNISESIFSLRANLKTTFPSFLYFLLKSYPLQNYVKTLAGGSVQKGIRMGSLKNYTFVMPTYEIQKKFDEIINPFIKKISTNLKEIKILNETRDTLLTKFISGKLKISNTSKIVKEVNI